jgi:hypothetical protein
LPEDVGIIDDGGEEIDGLDDGQIIPQAVYSGIFGMFHADDQIRIGAQRQILQCLLQVARTYFAGSTGAVYGFGQADLFCVINHFGFLGSFLRLINRLRDQLK